MLVSVMLSANRTFVFRVCSCSRTPSGAWGRSRVLNSYPAISLSRSLSCDRYGSWRRRRHGFFEF